MIAVALPIQERTTQLDELLYEVCEALQLSPTKYDLAESRYLALAAVLESPASPFYGQYLEMYPQGSMALNTTVKPTDGPFDLDFVCELPDVYAREKPEDVLRLMYTFFRSHGTYGPMTTLKPRCVRITYHDEFYLDILPACRDHAGGGTSIRVPDRNLKCWKASNPKRYILLFRQKSQLSRKIVVMDRAEPVPAQQPVQSKTTLQLVVQLLKRWRDLYYAGHDYPPISIVLTTLSAKHYEGEQSTSAALSNILDKIVAELDLAAARNEQVHIPNPAHPDEDFSERWKENQEAYDAFDSGIRHLQHSWHALISASGRIDAMLEALFGEVVKTAVIKQAERVQEQREKKKIGVTRVGSMASLGSATIPMRSNTNFGAP